MVFVGFRYVQIWIFLCSFSPTCLVVEKISIRQKKKFFWATEWALKYRGPTGPVEPAGPGGAGLGPAKKIRLLSGRVWVLGPDPRVGPGYEKTRPEPDPLPFLGFPMPQLVLHMRSIEMFLIIKKITTFTSFLFPIILCERLF